MNTDNLPLVSIGMPIYNAERYLRKAVEALLAQDYANFELIISDNASKDNSGEICREFLRSDPRIRYIPHKQNQGSPWNFAFVVQQARGDYFMWAADDDLWDPTYVSKCLAKLQSSPRAVLCCTEINFIDASGHPHPDLSAKGFKNLETEGMSPSESVHLLISLCGWFAIYGLMPLEATKKLSLGLSVYGWDVIFLMELLMMGHFVKIREPLFSYRIVKQKTSEDYQAEFNSDADPARATKTPFTDLAANLLQTVYRSRLSKNDKLAIFGDFISTLTHSNLYWRQRITSEILSPSLHLGDTRFAALLTLALSRSVPYEEFEGNAILESFFAAAQREMRTLQIADSVRAQSCKAMIESGKDVRCQAERLREQGKAQEAAKLLRAALILCETSELWHDWAIARLCCGHAGDAEAGFRRSLELDASNHRAALKLGVLLSHQGRNDAAIDYIAQSVPFLHEERADTLQLLSHCLSELSQNQKTPCKNP